MPTFRDTGLDFLDADGNFVLNIPSLARYVAENDLLLLLKLHPYMQEAKLSRLPGVIRYPNKMDIYPLLPLADVLITDYSSVSFDFLLLDRPVIYFAYDRERYARRDRGLWFDYETLPGPIVQTQEKLLRELSAALYAGKDSHVRSRKEWREKLFLHYDGKASERICRFIGETLSG